MTLDEILQDIHALEEDMLTYERKYGVLSETFYESYINASSLIAPNCRRATIDSCAVASARG